MRLFFLAALLAALLVIAPAAGMASTSRPLDVSPDGAPGYVHEVFTLDDGLPMAGLSQALRTRDGYLWLATFDGLVRFDGVHFEVFDSERVPALGSNRIANLVEARDGALWIRTEQGHVARYRDGSFSSCGRPGQGRAVCDSRQAGAAWYTMLAQDRAGTIWLAGRSGLLRATGGELRELPGTKAGSGARFRLQDRTGRIWVVSVEGVWSGRPGRPLELVDLPLGAFAYGAPSLAEDGSGGLWIATSNGSGRWRGGSFVPEVPGWGYVIEDGRGEVLLSTPDRLMIFRGRRAGSGGLETLRRETSPGTHRLLPGRSLCIGPHGEEWIAWRNTLYRNGFPLLRLPSPLDTFNSVTLDEDGSVWITTSRSGELHALHPARLTTIAGGLPSPGIYPVYEDRDGTILAGGYEFIAALAPGASRFQPRPSPPGPQQTVLSFLRDRTGRLWVGTTRGLFVQEGDGFAPVGDEALRTTPARALFEDSRGILWVGTERGLARREPDEASAPAGDTGRWSWIRPEDGLPFPWLRVIRETRDGTLWIGTNGGGVIRLRNGRSDRFTSITTAQGLSSDVVRSLWVAPDGHLWIGTESRGLNRLDPESVDAPGGPRIAMLGERQGLYSNGIHQMVPDAFGNLWMSSNRGLFRARLRDLDAVADGVRPWVETVAYTERDGMRVREANGSVQDAGFRDRSGRIWFPTQDGVVRVDPRTALRPGRPARVHVVRLRAGAEEVPLREGAARLSPTQRSFALELSAPTFQEPGRQRFRYRLVPYDRAWIDAGTAREAVYTKVPPGSYVFEVAATGTAVASVRLEVVPRFFETRAFLAACILAAISVAFAGVRLWGVRQQSRQRALERLVEERTATIADQAERLRELDHLKTQFFANVSHELRTPLTLTLGPLRDSLDGRFGPLREELAGQVRLALQNAERLLGLVDQLLDIARLDAGRLKLRPRRGDLAELVRHRVEAFLPLAERREVDLSLEAPPEPVEADFDEAQLEKVFDNLLVNALKFTPRGGRVRVALDAPAGDAEEVEVSVEDDGPGIPADQLERVFERFYQGGRGESGPGAGIGLALARQLAELHQGSIAVASEPGHGTRFTVRLKRRLGIAGGETEEPPPAAPQTGTPDLDDTRAAAEPAPSQDRTTVLVVDDNADIRAYVRRHLEPDYRVIEAGDGIQGLKRARSFLPDLVISDVMMPGLDGNALFRSLREDPELDLVPVILLTAKASAENRIQGLRDGVEDYLVKPFDPRELKARVDNLLASRRRLLERIGTPPASPPRSLRVSEIHVTPADESLLARVQAAVEERLGDPELTVESLAAALGWDRSYLLRKLRTLTGESPSALIRSLRLQRAEQLLRAGAGSVGEIAYSVGFKSVAHFSNAFQERYGERPSAFAARHRSH